MPDIIIVSRDHMNRNSIYVEYEIIVFLSYITIVTFKRAPIYHLVFSNVTQSGDLGPKFIEPFNPGIRDPFFNPGVRDPFFGLHGKPGQ